MRRHRMLLSLLASALVGAAVAVTGWAQDESPAVEVTIAGVEGELRDNVAAYLKIKQVAEDSSAKANAARLRFLHQQAEDDIQSALQPFGYYRPAVDSRLEDQATPWQAVYTIEPGPPLPIAMVEVRVDGEGADDSAFQAVLADLPLQRGDTLNHPTYEDLKKRLRGLATERGYFDARFSTSEIIVDLGQYSADIRLHYATGERYRFGELAFKQESLAPEFLERYIELKPGDPYFAPALSTLQSDLLNSRYYDEVIVSAPLSEADGGTVPVVVEASSETSREYSIGLGFGTDTGIRGRGGLDESRVNRLGHRYEVQLLMSQVKYSLAGQYVIPGEKPRTDSFNIRGNVTLEDSDVRNSTTASLGLTHQRQDGPWLKIASLDYQWERFQFGNKTETTALLMPGLNWSRVDAAPDRINVTDGNRFGFEFRGAHDSVLSDITFAQAMVRDKWITSFNQQNRLIVRGDAGATYIDDDDFDALPSSLRFFAGGDNSVRGYSLDSIGPRNEDGDVVGARYFLVGSIEYERRLFDKWSLAAFVDSGDAFDDQPEFRIGVGLGLRWQSPVGPVRVDLASGLDEPGDAVRLHVSLGPDL